MPPRTTFSDDPSDYFNESEKALANYDMGWAKAALYFRTGRRFAHAAGSFGGLSPLRIKTMLDSNRKHFEAGDTLELLYAIQLCAEENLPLPTWLAVAFIQHFKPLRSPGGPTSLDAVFHSKTLPMTTPQKAEQANRDWQLGIKVWAAVKLVQSSHKSLDTAVKAVLKAGDFGVGVTKAKQLVKMLDQRQSELTGKETLSQYWAKRRKE